MFTVFSYKTIKYGEVNSYARHCVKCVGLHLCVCVHHLILRVFRELPSQPGKGHNIVFYTYLPVPCWINSIDH